MWEVTKRVWGSVVVLAISAGPAMATDIYVDAVNGENTNNGLTLGTAKKTITAGVDLAKFLGGALVRVQEGTYDVALGESFPITIDANDISIYGDEVDEVNWPRIGGDINNTSTSALFLIDATSDDIEDISLARLYFLGENSASKDAPSAIVVQAADSYQVRRSVVSNCTFERSEMHASGADGRALIRVEAADSSDPILIVSECTLWVTPRGGVEVILVPSEVSGAKPLARIDECVFLISGDDTAEFGILCGGGEDVTGNPAIEVTSSVIDSTGVSSSEAGIETGIDIWLNATDERTVQIFTGSVVIYRNEIKGCRGDAVRVRGNEETESSVANIVIDEDDFTQNNLHHNGGAGLHVDWNDDPAYLAVNTSNNLIHHNHTGIWYEGITEDSEGAFLSHLHETIADNSCFGFKFDGTYGAVGGTPSPCLENMIVWGNNMGGAQSGGTAGWDPISYSDMAYSCWQGLSSPSNGNTNSNPQFAGGGSYDLTSSSTAVIDLGTSAPTFGLPHADLDAEDRTVNGDATGGDEPDMGAYEYDP